MSGYTLERKTEGDRLEKQNAGRLYKVSDELEGFSFKAGEKILDVGCGTGALTRFLIEKFPQVELTALDVSQDRLDQAKRLIGKDSAVEFICADITKNELQANHYDTVMSRFVMHHLENPAQIIQAMSRSLKSKGRLIIIDSDGVLFNYYCSDAWLMNTLEKIRQNVKVDLHVGRKLRTYFQAAGLQQVETKLIPMHFTGEDLLLEIEQYKERFTAIEPLFVSLLGAQDTTRFFKTYLEMLETGRAELFYNKFVCQGVKP